MTPRVLCAVLFSVLIGSTILGCGSKAPTKVPISGKITINGKAPSKSGYTLTFAPEKGAPSAIEVQPDGSFSGEAVSGKCVVELTNSQDGHGGGSPKPGDDSMYQNSFSPQPADVSNDANLTLDFKTGSGGGTAGGH